MVGEYRQRKKARLGKGALALTVVVLIGLGISQGRLGTAVANAQSKAKFNFAKVFDSAGGGNVAPCRVIADPYPEFNTIGMDTKNGLVAISDTNLKSLLVYRIDEAGNSTQATRAIAQIKGPSTYLSYATGVALDPARRMMCVTENDVGDDVACFPYGANGDYKATVLAVPHGSYGLAFSQRLHQMALSIEHNEQIIFYRTGATGAALPLRSIRGPHTQMADPHGIYWDDVDHEIGAVNHGNWSQAYWDVDYNGGGHYQPPSITVFADDAKGDVPPLRVIQGRHTQLNWPSGIAVDPVHNEIAVANTAGHSVLIFSRTATGDAKPIRVIAGPHSKIVTPMSVAFDLAHNTLWVTNFGHSAMIFDRTAEGDAAPRRFIRNAPAGTRTAGFGNPFTIAYDSKRDELIVPN